MGDVDDDDQSKHTVFTAAIVNDRIVVIYCGTDKKIAARNMERYHQHIRESPVDRFDMKKSGCEHCRRSAY